MNGQQHARDWPEPELLQLLRRKIAERINCGGYDKKSISDIRELCETYAILKEAVLPCASHEQTAEEILRTANE